MGVPGISASASASRASRDEDASGGHTCTFTRRSASAHVANRSGVHAVVAFPMGTSVNTSGSPLAARATSANASAVAGHRTRATSRRAGASGTGGGHSGGAFGSSGRGVGTTPRSAPAVSFAPPPEALAAARWSTGVETSGSAASHTASTPASPCAIPRTPSRDPARTGKTTAAGLPASSSAGCVTGLRVRSSHPAASSFSFNRFASRADTTTAASSEVAPAGAYPQAPGSMRGMEPTRSRVSPDARSSRTGGARLGRRAPRRDCARTRVSESAASSPFFSCAVGRSL